MGEESQQTHAHFASFLMQGSDKKKVQFFRIVGQRKCQMYCGSSFPRGLRRACVRVRVAGRQSGQN